jgi:type 1 glutamine amidotransferase
MPTALVLGGLSKAYHQFWVNGPAIAAALEPAGFEVRLSEDLEILSAPELRHYDIIVNYTTGRELSVAQWDGLVAFIRSGKGLVGIHNAADTFKNIPAYLDVLGGRFVSHPPQLDILMEYVDHNHPITAGLDPFTVHDELYLLDWRPERVHLLAQTRSFSDQVQPLAWVRQEGGGRVFYHSLGHNRETLEHPQIRALLCRGARWAANQPAASIDRP